MTAGLRRGLALLVAGVAAGLPWLLDRMGQPPEALRVTMAQFSEALDDPAARQVALPHRWQPVCMDCRTVWYQFDHALEAPPRDAQAVLLLGVADNAAAYLNGRLLGSGGRFSDPAARLGVRPLLLQAPQAWWQTGDNRLHVLVKADAARRGVMAAPAIGSAALLGELADRRLLMAVVLPQVLGAATAMLGVILGVLWFYRRQETAYVRLAAVSWSGALLCMLMLVMEPPWPSPVWDGLILFLSLLLAAALQGLSPALSAQDAPTMAAADPVLPVEVARNDLAPGPWRRWGGAAAWLALPAALLVAASATVSLPEAVQDLVRVFAALAWAAAGARWVLHGWATTDARRLVPGAMLLAAGAAAAVAAWPGGAAAPALGLPLALAALCGVAGWLLLLRFVETLNAAELLNIDLEGLVRARTAELQAQFERVRELERAQTLAAERERLMRDMHDGVGGHLVSMLAMIEADRRRPGELAVAVREALDDMRLMIDSLEPVDDDLNAVLAMFHDRLAPRLRAAQVELHWEVDLLQPLPGLTPARVLHVLRMLQEAVSNAVRHGRPRAIRVSANDDGQRVRIEVRDDGQGFDPGAAVSGRGLRNLQRRAAEVGAGLDVSSSAGEGTRVAIELTRA